MKLLIVDKQPMVRSGLKTIIAGDCEEYSSIYEAADVNEALSIVNKEKIQVIILDLDLCRESGIEFMKKAKKVLDKVKLIIFTDTITKSDFSKCEDIGVEGYVMKDAFVEDIVFALKSVIRGKKYYDPQVVKIINSKKEDKLSEFSQREKEVMKNIGKGMSNAQIASVLFISESTVKKYVSNILNKLGCKNRTEVVHFLYTNLDR